MDWHVGNKQASPSHRVVFLWQDSPSSSISKHVEKSLPSPSFRGVCSLKPIKHKVESKAIRQSILNKLGWMCGRIRVWRHTVRHPDTIANRGFKWGGWKQHLSTLQGSINRLVWLLSLVCGRCPLLWQHPQTRKRRLSWQLIEMKVTLQPWWNLIVFFARTFSTCGMSYSCADNEQLAEWRIVCVVVKDLNS